MHRASQSARISKQSYYGTSSTSNATKYSVAMVRIMLYGLSAEQTQSSQTRLGNLAGSHVYVRRTLCQHTEHGTHEAPCGKLNTVVDCSSSSNSKSTRPMLHPVLRYINCEVPIASAACLVALRHGLWFPWLSSLTVSSGWPAKIKLDGPLKLLNEPAITVEGQLGRKLQASSSRD
jgi:hypothetical protein